MDVIAAARSPPVQLSAVVTVRPRVRRDSTSCAALSRRSGGNTLFPQGRSQRKSGSSSIELPEKYPEREVCANGLADQAAARPSACNKRLSKTDRLSEPIAPTV